MTNDAPHSVPPAECPMHARAAAAAKADSAPRAGKCPVDHGSATAAAASSPAHDTRAAGGKCPVDHANMAASAAPPAAKCPVNHGGNAELNPLNNMPDLAQTRQPDQTVDLPTERVSSSIPNGDGDAWVYPSPQQFYNALRRKGWETPEGEIEVMVDIHNHLNEEAWGEILKWEAMHKDECKNARLLRLRGRPNDLSPKAWFAGWYHGSPRPFDRHDWFVDRCGKQVRYVIDYYSGPDEGDTPVFFLDVRPAVDSPTAAFDRMRAAFRDWWSGSASGSPSS
ncbi:holocytochrome c synthase [Allomyces javanicus]|nr:holocytochrome c synthase [Allomyces javanicus]